MQQVGYHPEVILAGRRINDRMGEYVAGQVARAMMSRGIPVVGSRVLVMGVAFKENCPDIRNSKVFDIITELKHFNARVDIWDPWVSPAALRRACDIEALTGAPDANSYDAIILAVGHRQFVAMGAGAIRALGTKGGVVYDVKGIFPRHETDGRL